MWSPPRAPNASTRMTGSSQGPDEGKVNFHFRVWPLASLAAVVFGIWKVVEYKRHLSGLPAPVGRLLDWIDYNQTVAEITPQPDRNLATVCCSFTQQDGLIRGHTRLISRKTAKHVRDMEEEEEES